MRKQLEEHILKLIAEKTYEDVEGVWFFRNKTPCSVCTSGARLVAHRFKGEVRGYLAKDSISVKAGFPIVEGHDFAWIENRWVVDYWAYRVTGLSPQPVLDLLSPSNRELALNHYSDGLHELWWKWVTISLGK